jgi:hypothetical protein
VIELVGQPSSHDLSTSCLRVRRQLLAVSGLLRYRVEPGVETPTLLLPMHLAGPCSARVLDEQLRGQLAELVTDIPVAVAIKPRLIPPTVSTDNWPLHLLFEREQEQPLMLSAQTKAELATLHRLQLAADAFIKREEVGALAKGLKTRRLTSATGTGPLNTLAAEVFQRPLNAAEKATPQDKQPLITKILFRLRQQRASGAVTEAHDIYLLLEEVHNTPSSFVPEIPLSDLQTHVANLKIKQLRKTARHQGRFYIPPSGTAVACVDPYHNFHNFVAHLLKQLVLSAGVNDGAASDDDGVDGDEDATGEQVLVLKHLLRAAYDLEDRDLITILSGSFDRHSHLCTSLVIDCPALWKKMRDLGYTREAKVLEVMGGAYAAWCKPHSTEGGRTRSLHLLTVMVHRLFGPGMSDVRVLTSKSFAGFPCRQWLDFIANADARAAVLETLSPDEREVFKETSMTTISVESSFAMLPSLFGSSTKPPAKEIMGNAPKLDAVRDIKRQGRSWLVG